MDTTAIKNAANVMMETLKTKGNAREYLEASRAKDAVEQSLVDQGRAKLAAWAKKDEVGFLEAIHWEYVPAIANTRNDMWIHPCMSQYLYNPRRHEYAVTTEEAISWVLQAPGSYFGENWLERVR